METDLDLDDVAAGHPKAQEELMVLRELAQHWRMSSFIPMGVHGLLRKLDSIQSYGTGNDGKEWPATWDATIWARAFVDHVRRRPSIPLSESTMLGWFANAIMVGYDKGKSESTSVEGGDDVI